MLDRTTFAKELRALADRFNRSVSDEMVRRYYEDLKHLATEDFLQAARTVYRNDTFWPAPNRFLEVAGVDPQTEADAAWELALSEATQGMGKPFNKYPPAHAHALRIVGGNGTIGRTNQDRLAFVKRDFVNAYKQHRERRPELEKPEPVELAGVF